MLNNQKKILGFDIGGTKTSLILGDSNGKIYEKTTFPTLAAEGFKKSFNVIKNEAKSFIGNLKTDGYSIDMLSVSIGGPLKIEKGIILNPPNLPGWDNIPLKKLLEKEFKTECYIEHDGNAGALAEFYFGAGKGFKNVIFLTMGTGMGAGIILNGNIYRGSTDTAGEVGHMRIAEDGPLVYGKKGSYESYASGNGIAKLANLHFPDRYNKKTSAKDVIDDYKKGLKEAKYVINLSAKYLGRGLALIADILNPEIIIIGSLAVRMGNMLLTPAIKEMKKEALEETFKNCKVVPSKLGEKIGDIASLCAAINRGIN
jgi:glucokinase